MADGTATLTYAVRFSHVGRYLGQLGLMLAILSIAPLVVSLLFGEYAYSVRFFVVITGLLILAFGCLRLPEPDQLQTNEGLVIVSLAFVLTPLLMAFPLAASGLPIQDVLFEAVSAITTTGLSTTGTVAGLSPTFLFARAFMQWYGGLGITVLSVALLMGHHAAARRFTEPMEGTNIATTAREHARQVVWIYVVLTLIGTALLWTMTVEPFSALVHMLSTLSTGGFSTYDSSLAGLPLKGAWLMTVFSLFGAVPLLLYFHAIKGRWRELFGDAEARFLVVAVLVTCGLLGLSLHLNAGLTPASAVKTGTMLGVSAQTTTGFSITSVAELDASSKLLMIVSMLIGGSSGSTSGGIKLLRLLVLARLLQHFLRRTAMPPHAVSQPRLGGIALEPNEFERAGLVIALFAGVLVMSWLAFLPYGYAPLDALFEVASALGTVGLSNGISAPGLVAPLKIVLCVDMLLGRLEIIALLVLLYPHTWIGKRAK